MENKINVGDQNTHQIGQNPFRQPIQIPKKPGVNYWIISTILLLVILLMSGAWFILNTKSKISSNQQTTSNQENIDTLTPTDSKSILEGKIFYNKRTTGETTILDFERKLTFNTGVKAYFGDSDPSQLVSPNRSKIILPGEEVNAFGSYPLSLIKKLFVKETFAMARDSQVHLFVVDLSTKQRQQVIGDFLVGSGGSRFIWLDDNSFCYKEIDVMQPTYKKFWKYDLAGNKEEATKSECAFPNPPTNPISQKYILNESTYQGRYETKIKNQDTNEEVILKPDSSCVSVPQAVLSPNGTKIAFACELEAYELNLNRYIYILSLKNVLIESYERALKIGYENNPYLQWINDAQLLVKSAVGYKTAGEMWDTAKIVIVKSDGSQQELVPKGTRITDGPVIAPNKKAFVYETIAEGKPNKSREGNEEIVVMSLDKKVLYRVPGTYSKWIR